MSERPMDYDAIIFDKDYVFLQLFMFEGKSEREYAFGIRRQTQRGTRWLPFFRQVWECTIGFLWCDYLEIFEMWEEELVFLRL